MNDNKRIDLLFLEELLSELKLFGKDKNNLIIKLGKVERKDAYNNYFLTPNNHYLKQIILCFDDVELKFITIFADFDFDFKTLIKKYGLFREHYSHYDDTYFYFFNENNKIPFYIECERNIKYEENRTEKNDLIKKIKIIFKKNI